MEPNRESQIHSFSRFRLCGRVFRRVALFYCVRRKRVFIAMGNENVDFRTLHFHCDFNEILLGPHWESQGLPRTTFGSLQGVPRDVLGASKDALRVLGDALGTPWDHPGLPWACQGTPRDVF